MRICIITFHRAYNCGAMLQAWALKTVLERMGHDVKFLISNDLGRIPPSTPWSRRVRSGTLFRRFRSAVYRGIKTIMGEKSGVKTGILYDKFREKYLPEFDCDDANIDKYFDLVIVGSDQVLCPSIDGWSQHFICTNVPDTVPKIVYSGSCGDKVFDKKTELLIDTALRRFSSVSVREPYKDYDVVVDPTLLLESNDYSLICKNKPLVKEPYLYVYSCTCTDFEIYIARKITKKLNLKLVISNHLGKFFRNDINEMVEWMSPSLLIEYIRNAKYVIAGSFHGTVLSILHNKPFITIRNQVDISESRPASFLRRYDLLQHLVNPETSFENIIENIQKPICSSVFCQLAQERHYSLEWLSSAMEIVKMETN